MAELLKNQFGADVPVNIAGMIRRVYPAFDDTGFVREVLRGYQSLDLMSRGWKIARTLRGYLPESYPKAIDILINSLGAKLSKTEGNGMASFLYLPHVCFVAEYGLDHFEVSMQAQYELTQRFTAEFSIRRFLERHTQATLTRLKEWASDPSPHVRRLVSEGTRPRLPWAPRLRCFQDNPGPVLALLELLKDDPELYVRRSVANNLNDIGKDHPDLLVKTARRWLKNATADRHWLINHALRSAIKRAEPGALAVLGYGDLAKLTLQHVRITPRRVKIGDSISVAFVLKNTSAKPRRALVDFRIHFIKANGNSSAKVFKLKTISLLPGENMSLCKRVSLAQLTTRKHYPGVHKVDAVINGQVRALGTFHLTGGNTRSTSKRR